MTCEKDDNPEGPTKRAHKFKEVMKDVIGYYSLSGQLKIIPSNGEIDVCVNGYLTFQSQQV